MRKIAAWYMWSSYAVQPLDEIGRMNRVVTLLHFLQSYPQLPTGTSERLNHIIVPIPLLCFVGVWLIVASPIRLRLSRKELACARFGSPLTVQRLPRLWFRCS